MHSVSEGLEEDMPSDELLLMAGLSRLTIDPPAHSRNAPFNSLRAEWVEGARVYGSVAAEEGSGWAALMADIGLPDVG